MSLHKLKPVPEMHVSTAPLVQREPLKILKKVPSLVRINFTDNNHEDNQSSLFPPHSKVYQPDTPLQKCQHRIFINAGRKLPSNFFSPPSDAALPSLNNIADYSTNSKASLARQTRQGNFKEPVLRYNRSDLSLPICKLNLEPRSGAENQGSKKPKGKEEIIITKSKLLEENNPKNNGDQSSKQNINTNITSKTEEMQQILEQTPTFRPKKPGRTHGASIHLGFPSPFQNLSLDTLQAVYPNNSLLNKPLALERKSLVLDSRSPKNKLTSLTIDCSTRGSNFIESKYRQQPWDQESKTSSSNLKYSNSNKLLPPIVKNLESSLLTSQV